MKSKEHDAVDSTVKWFAEGHDETPHIVIHKDDPYAIFAMAAYFQAMDEDGIYLDLTEQGQRAMVERFGNY